MQSEIKKYNLEEVLLKLYFIFNIMMFLIFQAFDLSELVFWESVLVILDSVILVMLSRKNIFLVYILGVIAFSNYSICYTNYIVKNTNTMFTSLSDSDVGFIGLQILFLFIVLIGLFYNYKVNATYFMHFFNSSIVKDNKYYLYHFINIVALVLICAFAYTRPEFSGERGAPSTIYEYSTILVIIGLYFSGDNRFIRFMYIATVFLYAAQNFIFGGRITGLQLIFILLIFFYGNKKISIKAIAAFIGLYILMVTIGELRGDILSASVTSFSDRLNQIAQTGFALDTAYSSYYTSLQFVLTTELISFGTRLHIGALQLLSYIIGGTLLPEANIANFVSQYYFNYMGGVLPFFGYFCFGWIGILIYAILVGIYISVLNRLPTMVTLQKKQGFLICMGVYLSSTAFRWYLYSPNNLLRGILLLGIVYFISKKILSFTPPNALSKIVSQ